MTHLDVDLDFQLSQLEREWRVVYEASLVARGTYHQLVAAQAGADALDGAKEALERAEAAKARIAVRIERLEASLLENGA